jgi:hypothetical protein
LSAIPTNHPTLESCEATCLQFSPSTLFSIRQIEHTYLGQINEAIADFQQVLDQGAPADLQDEARQYLAQMGVQ